MTYSKIYVLMDYVGVNNQFDMLMICCLIKLCKTNPIHFVITTSPPSLSTQKSDSSAL
jgi:hypothetical protein